MNSFLVFVLIVATFLSTISALPSFSPGQVQNEKSLVNVHDLRAGSDLDELILKEDSAGEGGDRFRRVTCDILSVRTKWVSFNHAPCAVRCIAKRKGYRGGFCSRGICYCRRGRHHG